MAKKKSEQIEASTEDQSLVRRVDEMMSTEPLPKLPTVSEGAKNSGVKEKILSIKSAPEEKTPATLSEALKDIKLDEVEDQSEPPQPKNLPEPTEEVEPPAKELPVAIEVSQVPEPRTKQPLSTNLDDRETDRAVDEIAAKEGDTILALEDAKIESHLKAANASHDSRLKTFLKSKWFRYGLIVIILLIFALPMTRYRVLGLVIKRSATVQVLDSKTGAPVNEAEVTIGGVSAQTNADGKVTLSVGVGQRSVQVTKQYYKPTTSSHFVGFTSGGPADVKLTATGRLVPITIINKINGKPVANASIKVLNTSAKTDAKGKASIALPITAKNYSATVTASAYNKLSAPIELTDKAVAANTLSLVPAGRVYFLAMDQGVLNVARANLDGGDRQTVVEGTGQEEPTNTSLLASRDWRYVVLKAKREGGRAALYLIDTSNDKVAQFDSTDASFNLIGWSGHSFVYSIKRNDQPDSKSGTQMVKSYDAERQQLNQLDQNQAQGDATAYAYQNLANFQLIDNVLVYTVQWSNQSKGDLDLADKNDVIRSVQVTGQGKKDMQSFPSKNLGVIQAVRYQPRAVYYAVTEAGAKITYYEYKNQTVKAASITKADFDKTYPDFASSASGAQNFWSAVADGQLRLFVAGSDGDKPKQLSGLGGYAAYGWHGNNYLLIANANSQLFIVPAAGLSDGRQPLKITDYYRQSQ